MYKRQEGRRDDLALDGCIQDGVRAVGLETENRAAPDVTGGRCTGGHGSIEVAVRSERQGGRISPVAAVRRGTAEVHDLEAATGLVDPEDGSGIGHGPARRSAGTSHDIEKAVVPFYQARVNVAVGKVYGPVRIVRGGKKRRELPIGRDLEYRAWVVKVGVPGDAVEIAVGCLDQSPRTCLLYTSPSPRD